MNRTATLMATISHHYAGQMACLERGSRAAARIHGGICKRQFGRLCAMFGDLTPGERLGLIAACMGHEV